MQIFRRIKNLSLSALFFMAIPASYAAPVNIAIVDSGVDFTHSKLTPFAFNNSKETPNGRDDDSNGFIDDINGWNMVKDTNKVFNLDFVKKYSSIYKEIIRAFELTGKLDSGQQITPMEKAELMGIVQNNSDALDIFGTVVHGTHCAGISTANNPHVKVLAVKMLGNEEAVDNSDPIPDGEEWETLEQLIEKLINDSSAEFQYLTKFLNTQNIKAINASWGMNELNAANMFKANLPGYSDEDYAKLAKYYLQKSERAYSILPKNTPNSLWVIAAGNDSVNNDQIIDMPANLKYPNTISVAAVDSKGLLAKFSNYGKDTVDIAAPGVAIMSTMPLNQMAPLSGTSMAAPYITKVASLVFAENSSLTPAQVKDIMMRTVDKKSYLTDKVRSGGIVNLERAVAAARGSNSWNLEDSIVNAYKSVPMEKEKSIKGSGIAKSFKDKITGFEEDEKELLQKFYDKILHIK